MVEVTKARELEALKKEMTWKEASKPPEHDNVVLGYAEPTDTNGEDVFLCTKSDFEELHITYWMEFPRLFA